MRIGNIGLLRSVMILIISALMGIFCLCMASEEIILHNSTPLDLSTATIDDIKDNTLVDAKITDTVGSFMYEVESKTYYYLIPMQNGKFIIFATNNAAQKDMLDTYIYSYNGTLDMDIKGRISPLSSEEKKVFFDSVVDADIGVSSIAEAQQYIVSYKIKNDRAALKWIWILIALIMFAISIMILLKLIKQKHNSNNRKNFVNAMPDNTNANAYNPYANNEYYTGYDDNQQGDYYTGYDNPQDTQTNNNQSDIHRF